jgi:hypothetical protein
MNRRLLFSYLAALPFVGAMFPLPAKAASPFGEAIDAEMFSKFPGGEIVLKFPEGLDPLPRDDEKYKEWSPCDTGRYGDDPRVRAGAQAIAAMYHRNPDERVAGSEISYAADGSCCIRMSDEMVPSWWPYLDQAKAVIDAADKVVTGTCHSYLRPHTEG